MHALTKLIKDDMKPALGVTEPGAIAFAVASAAERIGGGDRAEVVLNSGMYKNAFTCGIPHTEQPVFRQRIRRRARAYSGEAGARTRVPRSCDGRG